MKISKITIKDFRAFAHEETFDLKGGKNLLLYGENGSGKSSLFQALREFFGAGPIRKKDFEAFRNIFYSDRNGRAKCTDGHITLELKQDPKASSWSTHQWSCGSKRPIEDLSGPSKPRQVLRESAALSSFLDYRSLLRTNFDLKAPEQRLFELSVETLLADVPITLPGNKVTTIGRLWVELKRAAPKRLDYGPRKRLSDAEKAFNDGFQAILPSVQKLANEILSGFAGAKLALKLSCPSVQYDLRPKQIPNRVYMNEEDGPSVNRRLVLHFEVTLNGDPVPEWNEFLNEARLSALALSLYLAGVKLSDAGTSTDPLRLLVLDDVLIGLDLTNRIPVLKILEEHFSHYQVILLTHDKVWYEMAQLAFAEPEEWVKYEVQRGLETTEKYDVPVLHPAGASLTEHFIKRAMHFHDANHRDLRAAALYARVAFEVKLKKYCAKQKVQVAYDLDGRQLKTTDFLSGIERRLVWSGKSAKALFLIQRVKLFLDGVLNPLAHYHPVTLDPDEVLAAIDAVKALKFDEGGDNKNNFDYTGEAKKLIDKASPNTEELRDAACYLRTAFEVDLRALLIKHEGKIKYRDDWAGDKAPKVGELWDAAMDAMDRVNPSKKGAVVSAVEGQRDIFLDEWKYSTCSAFDHQKLKDAHAALMEPSRDKTRLDCYRAALPTKAHKRFIIKSKGTGKT